MVRGAGWQFRKGLDVRQVNFAVRVHPTSTANRFFYGEFDSGSERTLAACLRHASRTGRVSSNMISSSGARVSNT